MDVERYKKMKEDVLTEPSLEQVGFVCVETHHIKKVCECALPRLPHVHHQVRQALKRFEDAHDQYSVLPQVLVDHCQDWITKLIALMAKMIRFALDSLSTTFGLDTLVSKTLTLEEVCLRSHVGSYITLS